MLSISKGLGCFSSHGETMTCNPNLQPAVYTLHCAGCSDFLLKWNMNYKCNNAKE